MGARRRHKGTVVDEERRLDFYVVANARIGRVCLQDYFAVVGEPAQPDEISRVHRLVEGVELAPDGDGAVVDRSIGKVQVGTTVQAHSPSHRHRPRESAVRQRGVPGRGIADPGAPGGAGRHELVDDHCRLFPRVGVLPALEGPAGDGPSQRRGPGSERQKGYGTYRHQERAQCQSEGNFRRLPGPARARTTGPLSHHLPPRHCGPSCARTCRWPKEHKFNNGVADRQYVNYPSLARPAYGPAPTLSQPARCSLAFTTLERRESLLLGKSTRVRPEPAPCHLGGAGTAVPGVLISKPAKARRSPRAPGRRPDSGGPMAAPRGSESSLRATGDNVAGGRARDEPPRVRPTRSCASARKPRARPSAGRVSTNCWERTTRQRASQGALLPFGGLNGPNCGYTVLAQSDGVTRYRALKLPTVPGPH